MNRYVARGFDRVSWELVHRVGVGVGSVLLLALVAMTAAAPEIQLRADSKQVSAQPADQMPPEDSRAAPLSETDARRYRAVKPRMSESLRTLDWFSDVDQVFFDMPGDGAIWAASSSYKARFDSEGAMYVPYLGSDAPRNYPVSFRVAQLLVDGEPLDFVVDAAPVLEDHTVVFDRGTFAEQYTVNAPSLEQVFVFPSLPADGELVLMVDVETDLEPSADSDSLLFANERGRVHFSKAVVYDAHGRTAPAPTSQTDSGIMIRVPDAFLSEAVFPVVIDPVIWTWMVDGVDEDDRWPDVAYDVTTDRYHVVWERRFSGGDGDVFSKLYASNAGGVPNSEVAIDITGSDWANPKTANNNIANEFLVVGEATHTGAREIFGRTRAADSNATSASFRISFTDAGPNINPDVGGDPSLVGPTYYCVVWERAYSSTDHHIEAQLVPMGGTTFGATIPVDVSSGTYDRTPSISKSNGPLPSAPQEWNIVWQRRFDSTDEDIRGAQIHRDGTITTPSFSIDHSPENDERPTVSSLLDGTDGPRKYLVAYQRGLPTVRHIYGRVLSGSTVLASQNINIVEGLPIVGDRVEPNLASDGRSFVLAYSEELTPTDYDILIASFCMQGNFLVRGEQRLHIAWSGRIDWRPQLTSMHSGGAEDDGFMAVWSESDAPGLSGDLGGALYEIGPYCPRNDDCADAFQVYPGQVIFGNLGGADRDGVSPCDGSAQANNPDVWYAFTPSHDGTLYVDTCGTHDGPGVDQGMDTVLSVHSGCPGNESNAITCNDDAGSSSCGALDAGSRRDSSLKAPVTSNETVYIRVTHYGDAVADGAFRLNIGFPPINDDCGDALPIGSGQTGFSTVNATTDGPRQLTCGFGADSPQIDKDLWFLYTAPCTGTLTVSTCDSPWDPFDTRLALYQPTEGIGFTCPGGWQMALMACNDNAPGCGPGSRVSAPVVEGREYRIRVGGANGASGPGVLMIGCSPPGDINGDYVVGIDDLIEVLLAWGPCLIGVPCPQDVNASGFVDVDDLVIVLLNWTT